MKTFANTYLYNKYPDYEKKLLAFVMNGARVDKNDKSFEDIRFEVKRSPVSSSLLKVLNSPNTILVYGNNALTKAFKVTVMKDAKTDRKLKVFIDCSEIITFDGAYHCNNINVLIAYLVSAMHNMVYTLRTNVISSNNAIIESSCKAFTSLFTYIIDYLYKVTVSNSNAKDKCRYLACMYFLINLLEKDDSDRTKNIAKKISGLSDREIELINVKLKADTFDNIKSFIETLADVLHLDKLTYDIIVEKWAWLYGSGTIFGLELFTSFMTMITDAYVGAYLNNQKTIEKVADYSMVELTKSLLSACGNVI